MIRRIIWALKMYPSILILFVPAMVLEFPFIILMWLLTGKDALLWDNSPMVWVGTGWRWKFFCWPMDPKEFE